MKGRPEELAELQTPEDKTGAPGREDRLWGREQEGSLEPGLLASEARLGKMFGTQ